MKLYYSPGACSLSPHIVAAEAGIKLAAEKVDLKTKKTETGKDFNTINGKSYVPALELDNGDLLTEGTAIIQYLASLKPEANLVPRAGTFEHFRFLERLGFISTELHKGFSPLFGKVNDEADAAARKKLDTRLAFIADKIKGKKYVMGDQFTVADAYLFTVLRWATPANVHLAPALVEYRDRIAARPKVQEALAAEGLLTAKAA